MTFRIVTTVQPSPLSNFRASSSLHRETPSPLTVSPFPPPPQPLEEKIRLSFFLLCLVNSTQHLLSIFANFIDDKYYDWFLNSFYEQCHILSPTSHRALFTVHFQGIKSFMSLTRTICLPLTSFSLNYTMEMA